MIELFRNGPGSIGETTRSLLSPLKFSDFTSSTDFEDMFGLYFSLISHRATAANMSGQTGYNYLYDEPIHKFFEQIEESLGENEKFKLDIAIFCFMAIYLESKHKREGFREVHEDLRLDAFEVIYEEAEKLYPKQIFFRTLIYLALITKLYSDLESKYRLADETS